MNLQHRIDLLSELGQYILNDGPEWQEAREKAAYENGWFIPEFTLQASQTIAQCYLQKPVLEEWARYYPSLSDEDRPRTVGIIMAGNIPLVGFHDWMSVFLSGHRAMVKPSARDQVLFKQLLEKIREWDPAAATRTELAEMLKGCDAYIATGSNNSSRYFDYYFGKYPNIIRRNRTSVAILTGEETSTDLEALADDVFLYFGLGCRNVTKIYVPQDYDFIPLLEAFNRYRYLADHHKYKNNYDYNLALHLLNKKYYMTNGAILLVEEPGLFSPISQLNFEYYTDKISLENSLQDHPELQAIIGSGHTPFGKGQHPAIHQYADGLDTLDFLINLS